MRTSRNRFLLELAEHEGQIAPHSLQNALTQGLRAAARKQDRPEFMSPWAGQVARPATAAEIVSSVVEEADLTPRRLA